VDKLITTAKKDTLAARRQVAKTIHVKEIFKKFFEDVVPQFKDRNSGFTRVIKLGVRRGDGASLSIVELLTEKPPEKKETKEKKKGKARTAGTKK